MIKLSSICTWGVHSVRLFPKKIEDDAATGGVTGGRRGLLRNGVRMSVSRETKQIEMLMIGLFQSAGAILDRLVENGSIGRLEVDAALQAVEDRAFTEMDIDLNRSNPSRQALARAARTLRVINAQGTSGTTLSAREVKGLLQFERDF